MRSSGAQLSTPLQGQPRASSKSVAQALVLGQFNVAAARAQRLDDVVRELFRSIILQHQPEHVALGKLSG